MSTIAKPRLPRLGIVKGDKNGTVVRAKSPTQLALLLEFLIRTPEARHGHEAGWERRFPQNGLGTTIRLTRLACTDN